MNKNHNLSDLNRSEHMNKVINKVKSLFFSLCYTLNLFITTRYYSFVYDFSIYNKKTEHAFNLLVKEK